MELIDRAEGLVKTKDRLTFLRAARRIDNELRMEGFGSWEVEQYLKYLIGWR